MPGTITVNAKQTFAAMLLMSAAQKLKFGTSEPDISATGEKKFTVEAAVTYLAEGNMRPVSEVISVTVTGGDEITITPGTPVEFDSLRVGLSAPEQRANKDGNGSRIVGGKLWWQASGVRPVQMIRQPRADAAA